jgi:hypothetical protein
MHRSVVLAPRVLFVMLLRVWGLSYNTYHCSAPIWQLEHKRRSRGSAIVRMHYAYTAVHLSVAAVHGRGGKRTSGYMMLCVFAELHCVCLGYLSAFLISSNRTQRIAYALLQCYTMPGLNEPYMRQDNLTDCLVWSLMRNPWCCYISNNQTHGQSA